MEQYSRELDSFEELVEKPKDVKTKVTFQPRFYIKKIDQHYLLRNWPELEKAKGQYSLKI